MFVEVVFPLPVRRGFTYSVPHHLESEVRPGVQVLAPLGKNVTAGIVTRLLAKTEIETKPIVQVNPLGPLLSSQLLELTRWTANYYFCSWGEAIKAALPAGLQLKPELWVGLVTGQEFEENSFSPEASRLLEHLKKKPKVSLATLSRKLGKQVLEKLKELEGKGIVELSYSARPFASSPRKGKIVQVTNPEPPMTLGAAEQKLLDFLKTRGTLLLSELRRVFPRPEKILHKLEKEGIITLESRELFQDAYETYAIPEKKPPELSSEQRLALDQIESHLKKKSFAPFLLHGVTGSGKTEIYLRAGQFVLEQGRTVLILVPEISLTIQTILAFKSLFQDQVVEIHSGLTSRQRLEVWRRIKQGKYPVVIGVRSAIFAPLEKVGLIVVDEEHDSSYKQSDPAPRYNARDLALVRGRLEKGVVILGSATPSLESYQNALNGKYTLLTLSERVLRKPLPKVEIIDWKAERKIGNYSYLSQSLKQAIESNLKDNQQVILFLNRRGFSTLIKCQDCGYVPICRNCNVTLTFHLQGYWLRCHFCGYQKKAPSLCPACASRRFLYPGVGTQRIETEIKKIFGEASVRRLDSDLSYRKGYSRSVLFDFQAGKFPILLGTQMVAKGYDFPEVTLVGVISADTALELPDFRAAEKTFQLLTQVAGRSGRGEKPGEVFLQTYHPQESAIQLASQQDYRAFFEQEIGLRRELKYPPFCHLILILFSGVDRQKVQKQSENLKELLLQSNQKELFTLLGPAPAPLEKIRRKYRCRLMIKTVRVLEFLKVLEQALTEGCFHWGGDVRVTVDVDPLDML